MSRLFVTNFTIGRILYGNQHGVLFEEGQIVQTTPRKRIVIIGAGFAGIRVAQRLAKEAVDIILVDRNNYHTFTPLLYQVATCALDPSAVSYPVREIFERQRNVRFLLGTVTDIDYEEQRVIVQTDGNGTREEAYDFLFVAAGSETNFFGNEQTERNSFGLRDMNDALRLRHHVLRLFEIAAWTEDEARREELMTFVVVGGGPTGLETAGSLHELYNRIVDEQYDKDDNMVARVILLEAMDNILLPYPDSLQQSAQEQLHSLGVEVKTGAFVEEVGEEYVRLKDGEEIPTHTVIWATGVQGVPLARKLDVELAKGGRLPVHATMQVIGRENVYAAGDITYLTPPDSDQPYPALIPVAQQQADYVAKNIMHEIKGEPLEEFRYFDKGIMATIGRSRAVAWVFNRIPLTGFIAWVAWLGLHLITLMGMRNRFQVFLNWVGEYIFYDRSVQLILDQPAAEETEAEAEKALA